MIVAVSQNVLLGQTRSQLFVTFQVLSKAVN